MIGQLTSRANGFKSKRQTRPRVEGLEARALMASSIAEISLPSGVVAGPVASGSDGNLWFMETPADFSSGGTAKIARIAPDGTGLTEFSTASAIPGSRALTLGDDGNLWFTTQSAVDQITPDGTIHSFPVPEAGGNPPSVGINPATGVTAGPDGNIWVVVNFLPGSDPSTTRSYLVRVSPDGKTTSYRLPETLTSDQVPVVGSDGNLWVSANGLTRVTPDGTTTLFPLMKFSATYSLSPGPDGNLWFSEIPIYGGRVIGKVTSDGVITEYPVSDLNIAQSTTLTAGSDGNLWMPGNGEIGRITTDGVFTSFPLPDPNAVVSSQLLPGFDGNLWFTEHTSTGDKIADITPDGKVTELDLPARANTGTLTDGGDGTFWFSESGTHALGHVTLDPSTYVVAISLTNKGGVGGVILTPVASPLSTGSRAPVTASSLTRSGVKYQRTHLTLTFTGALDPTTASDPHNYSVILVGPRGHSRPHAHAISVKAASYNAATNTVTLTTKHRLKLSAYYRLTVNGATPTGLKANGGAKMVGNAGADFVAIVHKFGMFTPKGHKTH